MLEVTLVSIFLVSTFLVCPVEKKEPPTSFPVHHRNNLVNSRDDGVEEYKMLKDG